MSRYIEIELAMELCDTFYFSDESLSIKQMYDNAPSIDIVFCKDCLWARPRTLKGETGYRCLFHRTLKAEGGYCDVGERRESDE